MSKTKVLFAYCHELGRCLSIDEARTEFFSRKLEERKRFTFSCSDRNCNVTIKAERLSFPKVNDELCQCAPGTITCHDYSPDPVKV